MLYTSQDMKSQLPPRKLKSGRRLVAISSGGRVGLYRLGKRDSTDYIIRLPAGRKVRRAAANSYGYPNAPEGNWRWVKGRRPWSSNGPKEPRLTRKERQEAERRTIIGRLSTKGDTTKEREVKISKTLLCADCNRSTKERKHAHSAISDVGFPITLCCRCARGRGGHCGIYERRMYLRRKRGRTT